MNKYSLRRHKSKFFPLQFLSSLDAKEIYLEVMQHLPDFEMISAPMLKVKSIFDLAF